MRITVKKLATALACAALLSATSLATAAPRDHNRSHATQRQGRAAPQHRARPQAQRRAQSSMNRARRNARPAPQARHAPSARRPQPRRARPHAQARRAPQARHAQPARRHAPQARRHVRPAPQARHARRYYRGGHLPRAWHRSPRVVHNWHAYRGLYQPPRGYYWVRGDSGDMLLVAITTGVIAGIIANAWAY